MCYDDLRIVEVYNADGSLKTRWQEDDTKSALASSINHMTFTHYGAGEALILPVRGQKTHWRLRRHTDKDVLTIEPGEGVPIV